MPFDPEQFGHAMGEAIRKAVEPLQAEIADLRKQLDEASSQAPDVRQLVADEVAKAPAPKNGKDADEEAVAERVTRVIKADLEQWKLDAQSAIKAPDLPDIKGMVESAVSEAVKAIPAPKDGKSFTLEDATPIIDRAIEEIATRATDRIDAAVVAAEAAISKAQEAFSGLRQPEDGKSITVDDVRPLIEGEIEKAVKAIPLPKDGVGLAGMLIDRDGNLIATMTNGEAKNLGPVVGKDGVSLESFVMEYLPDTHEITIKATAAGRAEEVRFPAGGIRGKGYWRDGTKAKAGDAWTHDGSLWIAKADTETKPATSNDAWFLAARAGRNGETVVKRVKEGPQQPIRLGKSDEEDGK